MYHSHPLEPRTAISKLKAASLTALRTGLKVSFRGARRWSNRCIFSITDVITAIRLFWLSKQAIIYAIPVKKQNSAPAWGSFSRGFCPHGPVSWPHQSCCLLHWDCGHGGSERYTSRRHQVPRPALGRATSWSTALWVLITSLISAVFW